MLVADVRKLSPLYRLVYWVREREAIRLKKDAGEPAPWTDDEILRTYRFCCPRRMDDKVSQWLLRNWYRPFHGHPNMLAAVALARFVNKPESLERVTHCLFTYKRGGRVPGIMGDRYEVVPDGVRWDAIKTTLRSLKAQGATVFNGAYMVRGNSTKSPDKIGTVVDEYVRPLWDAYQSHPAEYVYGGLMWLTHAAIATRYGFGSFMAGQIVADLRWAVPGDWDDRHTWAPVGPGSARGLARVLHGADWLAASKVYVSKPDAWLKDFRAFLPRLKGQLPVDIVSRLEAHDYQNCLCEFDKADRVLWGEGKPKQRYTSRETPS